MSAHAGILQFDGELPDVALVKRLESHIDGFGPDGGVTHVQPGLAMSARVLAVTPEDSLERLPHQSPRGCLVTWDGRLDNRDDLLLQLGSELTSYSAPDSALAGLVYERWGHDGFARLIGDWSVAIWDPCARCVLLASDFAGNRGLYFTVHNHRLLWASSLAALLEATGTTELSAEFISGYLTNAVPPGVSPYARISIVPPAHVVTCGLDGRMHTRRYWELSVGSLSYRHNADYVVHLRELIIAGVQVRLRSSGETWAELSGGMDSSTVVCTADHLIRTGSAVTPRLRAISCYSTESGDVPVAVEI